MVPVPLLSSPVAQSRTGAISISRADDKVKPVAWSMHFLLPPLGEEKAFARSPHHKVSVLPYRYPLESEWLN